MIRMMASASVCDMASSRPDELHGLHRQSGKASWTVSLLLAQIGTFAQGFAFEVVGESDRLDTR
jgi:hypothetical protein